MTTTATTETIKIERETAELLAEFLMKYAHEWARCYDARFRRATVFDIHYAPSEDAVKAWHQALDQLMVETVAL
jgi:hypothetical protein